MSVVKNAGLSIEPVNPKEDEKKLGRMLLVSERGAILAVAVVSSIPAAMYGYDFVGRYVDLFIAKILGAATLFVVMTFVTDLALKMLIQKSVFDFLVMFDRNTYKGLYTRFERSMQVIAWFFVTALVCALYYFDFVAIDATRQPVANMAKQKTLMNADSIRNSLLLQENRRMGSINGAVLAGQKSVKDAEKAVANAAKGAEATQKGRAYIALGPNHSWGQNELAKLKIAASEDERKALAIAQKNLIKLEAQRTADLALQTRTFERSDSTVNAYNTQTSLFNQSLVSSTSNMFMYVGFGLKVIAGLIRALLVVLYLGGMFGKPGDKNGDGAHTYADVDASLGAPNPGFTMA